MPAQEESFSNPVAPPGESVSEDVRGSSRLTNADFRRLMMTPRVAATPAKEVSESGKPEEEGAAPQQRLDPKEATRANERKKKKSYYARIKKEDEQKMAELAEKYRDRALERRDGINPDYQAEDPTADGQGAYRAVAPDVKSGQDAAERRKQLIQESKFLGGDMEHTHLVKGLDYALLQKVRSEISLKETAESEGGSAVPETAAAPDEETEEAVHGKDDGNKMTFKTSLGRRIFQTIAQTKGGPEFNDLFLPGRMAYSIDLEADDEMPTTMIRSKADLQGIENMQATFTSNDLVIQKLSQILSYLRTGRTAKKIKKKDTKKTDPGKLADDSIYGDIGAYAPAFAKPNSRDGGRRDRGDNRRDRSDRNKPRESYFSKSNQEEHPRDTSDRWGSASGGSRLSNSMRGDPTDSSNANREQITAPPPQQQKKSKKRDENFYTECYPDMAEMHDAIDDSDDEADYTKMDLGNRKGPIGRWDFDTTEEYSDYMNQKEALPKAAFQYGVKMADGRKTRRIPGANKDRNAELHREWQQIQAIIKKRKDESDTILPNKRRKYD